MKFFLLPIVALVLFACAKERPFKGTPLEQRQINSEVMTNFDVPIKSGQVTYVILEGDTLAAATEPIKIKIPRVAASATRSTASQLEINYEIAENIETFSKYWQAIMFEDNEYGDSDYNDLIIHVRNVVNYPYGKDYAEQNVAIQPIALGGITPITLGCITSDRQEHIISRDVRKDLFKGREGFINTENLKEPFRYPVKNWIVKLKISRTATPMLLTFIEVGKKRFYAISSELNFKEYNIYNTLQMPYGIVAYSTFNYPEETNPIWNVYPEFKNWLEHGAPSIGKAINASWYRYSSSGIIGDDGVIRKIWDYQDLTEE